MPQPFLAEFEYVPSKRWALFLFSLVFAGALLLTWLAFTAEGGGMLWGVQLNPQQQRLLFGVFAILSPIGVIPIGCFVYLAFYGNGSVAITRTSVLAPQPTGWEIIGAHTSIPFHTIANLTIHQEKTLGIIVQRTLVIEHKAGRAVLPHYMFRSQRDFDQFAALVQVAVDEIRGDTVTA